MLVLALLVVPAILLEETASSYLQSIAFGLNVLIWAGFALELGFVLYVSQHRLRTLRAHWLDAAIVVVSFPVTPAVLQGARAARLLRLLRFLRLGLAAGKAFELARVLFSPEGVHYAGALVLLLVVVAGSTLAVVDSQDVGSAWDGIWWAFVTVTTVGYGDIYPTTVPGRIIAIVVMLLGIGFLALLTAAVAATFIKQKPDPDGISARLDEIVGRLERIESALRQPDGR